MVIDWESLEAASIVFPKAHAHIRRCALRLAVRREFVRVARRVRRGRTARSGDGDSRLKGRFAASTCNNSDTSTLQAQLIGLRRQATTSLLASDLSLKPSNSSEMVLATPEPIQPLPEASQGPPANTPGQESLMLKKLEEINSVVARLMNEQARQAAVLDLISGVVTNSKKLGEAGDAKYDRKLDA
jgi:hypothetical protein